MPENAKRTAIATVITLLTLIVTGGPAAAEPSGDPTATQRQVDAYLAAHPGGTQLNETEVSYSHGTFVVTVVAPAHHIAGPDCPSGWFCFYQGLNYTYPRGKLSSCGWQDLAWWGWQNAVESAHYNLATGTVWFINHSGAGHLNDSLLFDVGTNLTTRPDVAPYRNVADHVYRYC
jgi:hypothetical protein